MLHQSRITLISALKLLLFQHLERYPHPPHKTYDKCDCIFKEQKKKTNVTEKKNEHLLFDVELDRHHHFLMTYL